MKESIYLKKKKKGEEEGENKGGRISDREPETETLADDYRALPGPVTVKST